MPYVGLLWVTVSNQCINCQLYTYLNVHLCVAKLDPRRLSLLHFRSVCLFTRKSTLVY